jgi:hypothetical protein
MYKENAIQTKLHNSSKSDNNNIFVTAGMYE